MGLQSDISKQRYTLKESLYQNRHAALYRAVRNSDHQKVILEIVDPRRCQPRDVERLRNEQEIGAALEEGVTLSPGVIETVDGRPTLVFEDFEGQPLDGLLGAPMAVREFLELAIRISGAVVELHRQAVIHRDLKPENILVNPRTHEVKLAGLGLATRLVSEQQVVQAPLVIEGSLPYMSPEQSGRMNRATDSRSDLYSLGVTFYQMLTGRLPFEAKDPLEWIHCHIARLAPPPSQLASSIPGTLSAIVMKLLAKMAEERYQTAAGLRYDLTKCLRLWDERQRIDPFPLGEQDITDRFVVSQRLYGREAELASLRGGLERVVVTGHPELALVSGQPGVGKTALVNEMWKSLTKEHGFFASGKFDQYKRNIPYSTIAKAFGDIVLEILAGPTEQLAAFRQELLNALGRNGQVVIDVIPQVERVIGKQPAVPEAALTETQNRFMLAFQEFVDVFAKQEHPVAIFLDDLQWADAPSLWLIRSLIARADHRFFYVIGAYRDTEVGPGHPLDLTLNELRKVDTPIREITLGPLSLEHLGRLIAESFRTVPKEVLPLARWVHEKTAGNPFFATQILTFLCEKRLIEFDSKSAGWRWDMTRLHAAGPFDDVIELLVAKLGRFALEAQEVVKLAACLGNTCSLASLALAAGRTKEETRRILWEPLREGLLMRADAEYSFLHDRIQQAAYLLIPEKERAALHLRIGRLMRAHTAAQDIDGAVIEIVSQLNRGLELVTDVREREDLLRLNRQAGRKARTSVAYGPAREYFATAMSLLPVDAWSTHYDESFALHLECCECEYLSSHFEAAEALSSSALAHACSDFDRAKVLHLRLLLYEMPGKYTEAMKVGVDALRLFGVTFPAPDADLSLAIAAEAAAVDRLFRRQRPAEIVKLPVATDPRIHAAMGLLCDLVSSAFSLPQWFPLIIMKMVRLSLEHGNTAESSLGYSGYATLLAAVHDDIPSAFELGEAALELNEQFPQADRLRGGLLIAHGLFINYRRKPFATDVPLLERGILECLARGDLARAMYGSVFAVWHAVEKGDRLDVSLEVAKRATALARKTAFSPTFQLVRLDEQFVACLKGRTHRPGCLDDATFDEQGLIEEAAIVQVVPTLHIMKQVVRFLFGYHAAALESAIEAHEHLSGVLGSPLVATHFFWHGLTLAALYSQASGEQQAEYSRTLTVYLAKFQRWADFCPENFLCRFELLAAEVARIQGRELDAERLYGQASRHAREHGFVHYEALAHELAAAFQQARGFQLVAEAYLREARACYVRWGADAKVRQLDQTQPHLLHGRPVGGGAALSVGPEQLDLLSVLKASQTISSELLVEKLVGTLIQVALEQSGAQKGYLILAHNGTLSLEAEAALTGDRVETRVILPPQPVTSSALVPISLVLEAQRTRDPVILEDALVAPGEFATDPYLAPERPRSVLCLPLLRQAELMGLLYLENHLVAGAFTPERLTALTLLGSQAAISMENALLLAREREARTAAEGAHRRSAVLAEAGALLSESLAYEERLERLCRLCVRSLADWCVIDLAGEEGFRRPAGAHAKPDMQPLLEQLQQRYAPSHASTEPALKCLETGQPVFLPAVTDDQLRHLCTSEEHFEIVRELGTRSVLVVPLVASGPTLGAVTLAAADPWRFGRDDLALAQELAGRAAIAIENARLYRGAQQAIRMRDEFLSVASHELRTPMTSLMLTLQNFTRTASLSPELSARLATMAERQGHRLTRLIEELLEVSRFEEGAPSLAGQEVDLAALVRDVVTRSALDLGRAQCTLVLAADQPVVGVWDPSRLEQVVVNLLSNAIKFGAGAPIEVRVDATDHTARLSITDHGIGIERNQQQRIFDRFARAVSAQRYGGLGLGLFISRRIVEAHGGRIHVESAPGEGACFTVELPRLFASGQASEEDAS